MNKEIPIHHDRPSGIVLRRGRSAVLENRNFSIFWNFDPRESPEFETPMGSNLGVHFLDIDRVQRIHNPTIKLSGRALMFGNLIFHLQHVW